ncbi:hypothetical protein P8452_22894 [Trifolium repens]|nr:hypothetical protein P8452_22894 [Trifolium repens]
MKHKSRVKRVDDVAVISCGRSCRKKNERRRLRHFGKFVEIQFDSSGKISGRDVLAKTVYARLFDWLADKINKTVGQDINSRMQIRILDIYGFESFKDNRSPLVSLPC